MDYANFIQILITFVFGTAIGSFLNVLIWRLPRDQKPDGRSKCPNCNHQLIWKDLVPIFSFLFSGGKCRYCKKAVSWRYLIIEIITGLLFVSAWVVVLPLFLSDWILLVKICFIISVLITVFVIDLEHYLILDKIVIPATLVILAINLGYDLFPLADWRTSLLVGSFVGMLAGFIPFFFLWLVSKGKWIGLGDAKFGIFLGAVFGFPQVWVVYLMAFLIGTVVAIPLLVTGKKELSGKLPLGTFLAISALVTLWFGVEIASWYFRLIGLA